MEQVANPMLGLSVARANLLTNGGMEVWQRGTSAFTVGSNGMYGADRWQLFILGTSTLSVVADASNQDSGSWRCLAATVGGGAAPAAGAFIYQNVISSYASGEGQELRGRTLSLSARVRCSVANGCRIAIYDATGSVTTYSAYHSGGGAYETLRVTTSSPISAGCINGQIRAMFDANGTYYVDNMMLVHGAVAADYVPMHPADDLARCQRYYEELGPAGSGTLICRILVPSGSSGYADQCWRWMVRKAVTPTVTKNGTWQIGGNASQPAVVNITQDGIRVESNASTAGDNYAYNVNAGCNITAEETP